MNVTTRKHTHTFIQKWDLNEEQQTHLWAIVEHAYMSGESEILAIMREVRVAVEEASESEFEEHNENA